MRPAVSTDQLRDHFGRVMARRGARVPFERFEAASIRSGGIELHLDVIPVDDAAPTVVFVPGTSVYGLVYGDLLAALADGGCNVVSVDLRGHGRSSGARGDYTIPELVDDARAAVRYARDRFDGPLFAFGSSQGGIVAFYLAATDADLAGVICHNAADLGDPRLLAKLGRSPALYALRRGIAAAATWFPHAAIDLRRYLDLLSRGHDDVKARLAADPLTTKVITLRALASLTSASPELPVEAVTTPVMLLHGGEDTLFPQAYIEELFGRLTCEKSLRVWPELDHFLCTEQVGAVVPDVLAWIAERSDSRDDGRDDRRDEQVGASAR